MKIEIDTIDVRRYSVSGLTLTEDHLFHQKSLPVLSVVQALEGSYDIQIGSGVRQQTGRMVFIAPSEKMQYITHHTDPRTGVMRAHWMFLEVLINQRYPLDLLFDFPVILPPEYQEQIHRILRQVGSDHHICDHLSAIYQLIKLLLEIGTPKTHLDHQMNDIRLFISQHYSEKITAARLADQFALSVPTIFRKCKQSFHMTPAHYINDVRLSQAAILLEITDQPVSSISESVGFSDVFYFSKLFKRKYGRPPSAYRKQMEYRRQPPR